MKGSVHRAHLCFCMEFTSHSWSHSYCVVNNTTHHTPNYTTRHPLTPPLLLPPTHYTRRTTALTAHHGPPRRTSRTPDAHHARTMPAPFTSSSRATRVPHAHHTRRAKGRIEDRENSSRNVSSSWPRGSLNWSHICRFGTIAHRNSCMSRSTSTTCRSCERHIRVAGVATRRGEQSQPLEGVAGDSRVQRDGMFDRRSRRQAPLGRTHASRTFQRDFVVLSVNSRCG